jgi:cysteine sulfinate desulfinase/cysteine desulfurase-like protein
MRAIAPEAEGRAVRLSFAHYNTIEEVDRCFDVIDAALDRSTLEPNLDDETESGAEAIAQ